MLFNMPRNSNVKLQVSLFPCIFWQHIRKNKSHRADGWLSVLSDYRCHFYFALVLKTNVQMSPPVLSLTMFQTYYICVSMVPQFGLILRQVMITFGIGCLHVWIVLKYMEALISNCDFVNARWAVLTIFSLVVFQFLNMMNCSCYHYN